MRGALSQQIHEVAARRKRPRFLDVRASLLVHDRRTSRGRCPCCDSATAEIIETLEVADLVIDLRTGDRLLPGDMGAQEWTNLCGLAQLEEIKFRCSRHQKPLILDETPRHLFASGGNRSSKTTAGMIWLCIQWLRRGGDRRRFWLCSSTSKKAHELLMKIFKGTGESPRILPSRLYRKAPATDRSGDQQTYMIDGSIIDLKSYDGDPEGGRLKSDAIVAALVDEAAHLAGKEPLDVLRGRCMDVEGGGRLFLATTATLDSFLKEEVVTKALAYQALPDGDPSKNDKHEGSRWHFAKFPLLDNPWIPRENIERELATLDPKDPSVLRNYYGEWVTSTGPLWRDFEPERHILRHEARDFKSLGPKYLAELGASDHVDITGQCVSLVFGQTNPHHKTIRAKNRRYILGTDVNVHPMTSIALQVTAPRGQEKNRDAWHFWAMEHVRTGQGSSFAHVDQLQSTRFGEFIDPKAGGSPFAGCGVVVDAKAFGRDPTVHKFGGDPRGLPDLFARAGFDARAPLYVNVDKKGKRPMPPGRKENFMLVHRVLREGRLHVSDYCRFLIESFMEQQDSGDGVEPLENDRLASPMDGLRYAMYAIVHADTPVTFGRH